MTLHFINQEDWSIDSKQFEPFVGRLKAHIQEVEGDLNVVFVDDDQIHELNKEHRDMDKPTDVLSFPYLDAPDFEQTRLIGEIYISIPTAKRQAEEQNESLEDQLARLFVHGALHVFGYDHVKDEDYKKMHEAECDVLQKDLPM